MKIKIVVNPVAGRERRSSAIPIVERVLKEQGIEYSISKSQSPGEAVRLARQAAAEGYERIVAMGGDGTVCEVVSGFQGSGAALGIIPVGTGNDLARVVGIPSDPEQAARLVARGTERLIDLARLGEERYFANMASAGFPIEVIEESLKTTKKYSVSLAYPIAIAKTITRYRPRPVEIVADGQVIKKSIMIVSVGNGRAAGNGLLPTPRAELDDGLFDVCIVEQTSKLDFLRIMLRLSKGRHLDHPRVQYLKAREVTLRGEGPITVDTDGELSTHDLARFHLVPGGLRLLAPRP